MVRREFSCTGVHLPITHFTDQMEYYPAALPYIIIDKNINFPKRPRIPMTVDQRRSFISRIMKKLDRTFFFVNDYVVDVTPKENIFASRLNIDATDGTITSLEYTREKEYLIVPRANIVNLINRDDSNNDDDNGKDCVDRICANTAMIQKIFI